MSRPTENTVGMVGLFDDPDALIRAAERVRDEGFTRWDCHTPFPVHGLDRAMGLKSSPVPTLALAAGFVGLLTAVALTGGLNVIDYPIRIAGKPIFSWQAFVPIYFELFVLFAALTLMASLFLFCGLGRWHSPLHDSDIMKHVTGHRFAIVLEATDRCYSEQNVRALLEETGCRDVRPLVEFEEEDSGIL
ncbi:MAG: DUF3341 domain-containing protein [Phycisphaerales bacterium]|nr:MAG: DUF3341 domain-containing protein [Phycisphaerales bacterium]